MSGYYISAQIGYYEGDRIDPSDIAVTQRPGVDYEWDTAVSEWIINPALAIGLVQVAIQQVLDATAKSRQYDDIKSACAYASQSAIVAETDPSYAACEKFRLEGNALQLWMALTWAKCYAYLATVNAGTATMPTPEEAVGMIPEFTWPDEALAAEVASAQAAVAAQSAASGASAS